MRCVNGAGVNPTLLISLVSEVAAEVVREPRGPVISLCTAAEALASSVWLAARNRPRVVNVCACSVEGFWVGSPSIEWRGEELCCGRLGISSAAATGL